MWNGKWKVTQLYLYWYLDNTRNIHKMNRSYRKCRTINKFVLQLKCYDRGLPATSLQQYYSDRACTIQIWNHATTGNIINIDLVYLQKLSKKSPLFVRILNLFWNDGITAFTAEFHKILQTIHVLTMFLKHNKIQYGAAVTEHANQASNIAT